MANATKPSAPRPAAKASGSSGTTSPAPKGGGLSAVREWSDAIIIAFLLAMFIRLFVAELFKIPSSSMTPTLLGTDTNFQSVSFFDVDKDGKDDMILRSQRFGETFDVYLKKGKRYEYAGAREPGPSRGNWMNQSQIRQDRILVGKFFYWFSTPKRGDIVVFKVPECIFDPEKPIYIKRVTGLPGETLTFDPAPPLPGHEHMGWLVAGGKRVESPGFFGTHSYETRDEHGTFEARDVRTGRGTRPDYAQYRDFGGGTDIVGIHVPNDGIYVFGDNTVSSQDSRYWGKVPFDHLRGRAILRYYRPLSFLH